MIEINLAVVVTCMPSFKPFLLHVIPGIGKTFSQSSSSGANARHTRPSFVRSISRPSNPVHTNRSKDSALVFIEGGSNGNVSLASSGPEKFHDGHDRLYSIEDARGFR